MPWIFTGHLNLCRLKFQDVFNNSKEFFMIHADIGKQLMIHLSDEVGKLAEVTTAISASGINMTAVCAYASEGNVAVMCVTEDNNEAKAILESKGLIVQEEEVVLLSVDNKPGTLQTVTNHIAAAGIDLKLMYGSVDASAEMSKIVLISDSNHDVVMVIKTELERG